ncbi:amino acid adenylation domain-containing protein [Actinacidiphila acidipaludis]|uniref:Amino acid adenylation domain-containing protein n=1 Tax=Actinacidiphila acidipaludis TaxID=2873382 RepID=A0ABS7QHM5_9ACTN|nr:non-ribosomal peptide synthetase [Streptomyces acidipaludis]MBY8882684.1 amino acid adenylation domain-containing protein [Streptomyces acidipaludis]
MPPNGRPPTANDAPEGDEPSPSGTTSAPGTTTAPAGGTVLDGGPAITPAPPVTERIAAHIAATPERIALVGEGRSLTYGELALAVAFRADELAAAGAGPGRLVALQRPRGIEAIVSLLAILRTGAAYLPLDPAAPQARTAAILANCCGPDAPSPQDVAAAGELVLPGPGVAGDTAYVIHTSGSTGTPNGVAVGTHALAHFTAGATVRYDVGAGDRVLQFAPLHFDASVEEVFVTLGAGATLVLRDDEMLDVPGLLAGCAEHAITVLDLPTAYWHELAHVLASGTGRLPASVRTVVIGGEAALPERVAQWNRATEGRVRLLNTYGPTETTVVATVADLTGHREGPVPIGVPLPGVLAEVVDGELMLSGPALAHGYVNRPELTAERFVVRHGRRAYRTGDVVEVRPDGQLGYRGRRDDEVKISGHRIDPASVESVLAGHPAVRAAAVVVQEGTDGARRLVAFVAADGVSADELRALAREQLAPAAVPSAIALVGDLPRTSSGKIDRKLLRTAPVRSAATDALAVAGEADFDGELLPEQDRVPLSFAQRRLWFLGRMDGPTATYNLPVVLRLDGVPGIDALRAALGDVAARHETLRTVFPAGPDGEPYQHVLDRPAIRLEVRECAPDDVAGEVADRTAEPFDVTCQLPVRAWLLVPGDGTAVLILLLHHIATDGWSLTPLLRDLDRAYTARRDDTTPEWAPLPIQYADYTLWQHDLLGDPHDPTSLAHQQLTHWETTLTELPTTDLPTDRPRPLHPTHRGATVTTRLEPAAHGRLQALADSGGASLLMVAQAALAAALAAAGAGEDIAIGTPVAGRNDEMLDDLVGFFVNTLVLRTAAPAGVPADRLVAGARDAALAAFAHQDVPFDMVVEYLNPPRTFGRNPFFQVMVSVDTQAAGDGRGPGQDAAAGGSVPLGPLAGTFAATGLEDAKFDLSVSCVDLRNADGTPAGFEVWWQYAVDLFDEDTARLLLDAFVRALHAFADAPHEAPAGLLGAEECAALAARRERVAAAAAAPEAVRAGGSPREEILCALFAEAIGVDTLGPEDDFFAAGGHSMSGVRLMNRVRAVLGVEARIRDLFLAPTPAALARRLGGAAQGAERPAPVPVERPQRVPLSYAQRRLWFLDQLEGPSRSYTIPIALRLRRPLDPAVLSDALADVAGRHEVLRTVYPAVDGNPFQRVLDTARPVLEVVRTTPGGGQAAVEGAAGHVFDLAADLPLRAWLVEETATSGAAPATAPDANTSEAATSTETVQFLLLVVHHIAADGWSTGPLLGDLAQAYAARAAGAAPDWAPLPVQYADYTLWQERTLGDADEPDSLTAAHLTYWQQQLTGTPPVLELPAARTRPAEATHRGGQVPVEVDAVTHQLLAAAARRAGATVFMAVQAALAATLTRHGAGTDVVLGTVVAGRDDEALDRLVGFFVNTLALRTDTSGRPSFGELLERVRDTDLAAYAHQDLPFDRLVEHLNPQRSAAHHPLVQVIVQVQAAEDEPGDGSPLAGTAVGLDTGMTKFDLTLSLRELKDASGAPGGLAGVLEYATDVYDAATAELLAGRLARLLREAAERPELPVDDLDLRTPADERLTAAADDTTTAPAPVGLVHEVVAAWARREPGRVALRFGDQALTYGEVEARSAALAGRLVSAGVRRGGAVGVFMERVPDLVVAALAAARVGAAYVPMDPRLPAARVRMMAEDTGAAVLLTRSEHLDAPAVRQEEAAGLAVLALDAPRFTEPGDGLTAQDDAQQVAVGDADVFYVMFTSGSTGRPKGVAVTHRNVAELAADRAWDLANHRRMLVHSAIGFDASTYELWVPLLNGCELVMAPGDGADLGDLDRTIREHDVTAAYFTMGLFHVLADEGLETLARLREVWTGGDVASPAALRRVLDHCPDTTVVHSYGPTETTFASHHQRFPAGARQFTGVYLGLPMDNTRVYVLDERLRPVPAGVPGEMYLAGSHVARGYVGRPGLTAERFLPDPFTPGGGRMYRSGDLVLRQPDGELRFLGRADGQVKLRGFRIEPGEVEAALARHPSVGQAAVLVREDRPGDRQLVGYAVPRAGAEVSESALLAALGSELPTHMVPSAVVLVDAIPLTVNGKPDRAALPAPARHAAPAGRRPRNPREEVLCGLFAEILNVPGVGIDDNFFALGGHSLLGVRLTSRMRTVLGVERTVRDLFRSPTVAGLLAEDDGDGDGDPMGVLLPLNAHGSRRPLFCVHPGTGVGWSYAGLAQHLGPDQPLYALQTRALAEPGYAPQSVEEMADEYLARIRRIQPWGPYRLLGWSFGGTVAHAMAARLQEQGDRVEVLAMMDVRPMPPQAERVPLTDADKRDILFEEADDGSGRPFDLPAAVTRMRRRDPVLADFSDAEIRAVIAASFDHAEILPLYDPRRVHADLLFFTARRPFDPGDSLAAEWAPFVTGTVENHGIDCPHLRMAEAEPLARIGRVLADALRTADTAAAESTSGKTSPRTARESAEGPGNPTDKPAEAVARASAAPLA